MSLSGQWIARYAGSNAGTLVIELDEIGNHYEGTACAWDDKSDNVNSLVRIRTSSKEIAQRLDHVPVQPIDTNGTFIQRDVIEQLKSTKGLLFPETVDIEFALEGQNLSIKWNTSVASGGRGIAIAPKTRGGLVDEI